MENCPIAAKYQELENEIKSLKEQVESWRTEAQNVYKENDKWVFEHQELVEFILGHDRCDNLDEALHCIYQQLICLRKKGKENEELKQQVEHYRAESNRVYDENTKWVSEHQELVDFILGHNRCHNLDEGLHCLYQQFIRLRKKGK